MASARRRKRTGAFFTVLFLLLSIAAIAVAVLILVNGESGEAGIAVMEQRLRDLRQLKTVTQTYRSVIYVEERNFWRGSKEVLFTLRYEVSAGVDFSKGLEIEELSRGVYKVRMPGAEVFESDAVESSIRQMIFQQSTFNPINMGDYMPQIVDQGKANHQAAIDSGILGKAEANARQAVLRILKLGDVDEVVFETIRGGGEDG